MKRTLSSLLVLSFAAAAAPAFAEEWTEPLPFVSSRSRAEVIAETRQANYAGLLGDAIFESLNTPAPSTLTRAEVRAEFLAAREATAKLPPKELIARARFNDQLADVQ
ncbi:MAG: hypothetical protein K0R58_2818 [Ramlibacter sp.]|jgi:hypothetical protein|nr:hypothetical protein [Ramlibacter sp.]